MLHGDRLQALPLGMAAQHLPAKQLRHAWHAPSAAWVPVEAGPGAGALQVNSLQGCQQQLPSTASSMLSLPSVQTQSLRCLCRPWYRHPAGEQSAGLPAAAAQQTRQHAQPAQCAGTVNFHNAALLLQEGEEGQDEARAAC